MRIGEVLTMSKEYIEREVISEGIRKYYYKNPPNSSYQEGFDRGLDKAQRVILNAPVADVAEVRHGRWIVFYSAPWKPKHSGEIPVFRKSYKCSECCRRTIIAENYCPNCGAIMDNDEVRSQCKVNYNAKKGQL